MNWFIVGFIILFLIIVSVILTTVLKPSNIEIQVDQASTDRLSTLNKLFESYLGQYWKYVMLIFSLILFVFIVLLYYTNSIDMTTCSEDVLRQVKTFWIVALSIFLVLIFAIAAVTLHLIKQYVNNLGGSFIMPNTVVITFQVVGGIIATIFMIGAFFYVKNKLFGNK
jgi:hypothetical protein